MVKNSLKTQISTTVKYLRKVIVPKESYRCICLSEILIDSVFRIGKS